MYKRNCDFYRNKVVGRDNGINHDAEDIFMWHGDNSKLNILCPTNSRARAHPAMPHGHGLFPETYPFILAGDEVTLRDSDH